MSTIETLSEHQRAQMNRAPYYVKCLDRIVELGAYADPKPRQEAAAAIFEELRAADVAISNAKDKHRELLYELQKLSTDPAVRYLTEQLSRFHY